MTKKEKLIASLNFSPVCKDGSNRILSFFDEIHMRRGEEPDHVGCEYVQRVIGVGEFHSVQMQTSAGIDMCIWMNRMIGYKGKEFVHHVAFRKNDIAEAHRIGVDVYQKEFDRAVREFVISTGFTEEQYQLRKR